MTFFSRILLIVKYGKISGSGHLYRSLTLIHYIPYVAQIGLYLIPEDGQNGVNLILSSFESEIHLLENEASISDFSPEIVVADVLSDTIIKQHIDYTSNERIYPSLLYQLCSNTTFINITDIRINQYLRGLNIISNQYCGQYFETLLQEDCLVVGGSSCIVLGNNNRLLQSFNRFTPRKVRSVLIITTSYATSAYIQDLINIFKAFPEMIVKLISTIPPSERFPVPPHLQYISRRIPHKDLLEEMVNHDVVITNEGQSKIDPISLGIPTIVIPLFDNSSIPFHQFESLGVCVHTPKYTHSNLGKIKACVYHFLSSYSLRGRLAKLGSTMISDEGLKSSIKGFLTNEMEKTGANI